MPDTPLICHECFKTGWSWEPCPHTMQIVNANAEKVKALELQVDGLQKEAKEWKDAAHKEREYSLGVEKNRDKYAEDLKAAERLISEFPKKLLEAVLAEQDRCAKIAEAYWNEGDKLNADLRANLTQPEKNMAYGISTNIRALRRRESDFAEKPERLCLTCGKSRPCPDHTETLKR